MKKLFGKIGITVLILLTQTGSAYAQLVIPKPSTLPGPSTSSQKDGEALKEYFNEFVFGNFTNFIISLAGMLSFLLMIISGVRMLIAYGNEEEYTGARKMFFMSMVGFVIALLSYAIVSIITRLQF